MKSTLRRLTLLFTLAGLLCFVGLPFAALLTSCDQASLQKVKTTAAATGQKVKTDAAATAQKIGDFAASPTGKVVISGLENAAISIGVSALEQYSNGGDVNTNALGLAGFEGGIFGVRSLQNPANPAPPTAAQINSAISSIGGNQIIADAVSQSLADEISKAVSKGLPANVAIEHAAVGLDKAAVVETPAPRGSGEQL